MLSALEEDWDTYDGLPPSEEALRAALGLLEIIHELHGDHRGHRAVPYAVSPLATGGVEIEWRAATGLIRVDVGSEGDLDYLVRRDGDRGREYSERHGCALDAVLAALDGVLRG